MTSSIVERIAKILNQAENAGTEAEAKVFMDKAQEMSTRYSVDLAKARHMTVAKERTVPITRRVMLGKRGQRGLNTYVALITGIAEANDLKMTIAHNSTFVNLYGFAEDIDVTEALYASLLVQMGSAAEQFKRHGDWKEEKVYREGRWEYYRVSTGEKVSQTYGNRYYGRDIDERWIPGGYVSMPWLSARLDFQQAFASRVSHRLYLAKIDAEAKIREEEAAAATANTSAGSELVLVEKREAVRDYYAANNNARGSYRGHRCGVVSSTASRAGSRAGDAARLTNASSLPGARKAVSA